MRRTNASMAPRFHRDRGPRVNTSRSPPVKHTDLVDPDFLFVSCNWDKFSDTQARVQTQQAISVHQPRVPRRLNCCGRLITIAIVVAVAVTDVPPLPSVRSRDLLPTAVIPAAIVRVRIAKERKIAKMSVMKSKVTVERKGVESVGEHMSVRKRSGDKPVYTRRNSAPPGEHAATKMHATKMHATWKAHECRSGRRRETCSAYRGRKKTARQFAVHDKSSTPELETDIHPGNLA